MSNVQTKKVKDKNKKHEQKQQKHRAFEKTCDFLQTCTLKKLGHKNFRKKTQNTEAPLRHTRRRSNKGPEGSLPCFFGGFLCLKKVQK